MTSDDAAAKAAAIAHAMAEDTPATSDRMAEIERAMREHGEIARELGDLEQRAKQLADRRTALERERLPELFAAAGIDSHGLAAQGNLPAVDAELTDFFRANIAASWDAERREHGFAVLDELGLGDVISVDVTVHFPRGQEAAATNLVDRLTGMGIEGVEMTRSCKWNVLSAALREHYRLGGRLTGQQLDAIGGYVGRVVVPKERRG